MTEQERIRVLERAVWEAAARHYGKDHVVGEVARAILAGDLTTRQARESRIVGEALLEDIDHKLEQMRMHTDPRERERLEAWLRGENDEEATRR